MMLKNVLLMIVSVVAPVAISHALTVAIGTDGHTFIMLTLAGLGFAFLVAMLRPRLIVAIAAAILYFPFVILAISVLGIRAGYFDYP